MKIVQNAAYADFVRHAKKDEHSDGSIGEKFISVDTSHSDLADEPLVRMYQNWLKDGNSYSAVGDVSVESELIRSAYNIRIDNYGRLFFDRVKPKTAELYKFKSGPMEEVLSEIDKFWDLKKDYEKLGIIYSRGLLLFGSPGAGKSSIIYQVVELITKRGDIVFYGNDVAAIREALKQLRSVEPDRRVVVILEDADEQMKYREQDFLHLLDGQDAQESVLYLATTNYIDRFPARMLRSGRFDKKIEVSQPPLEGRRVYLKNKLMKHKMETEKEIDRLADETDGMSFGDLLELVTAVYALKEPVEDVLARLRKSVGIEEKLQDRDEGYSGELKMILPASKSLGAGRNIGAGIDLEYLKKELLKQ